MSERLKNQYDSLYASGAINFGDGMPILAIRKLTDYISSGTVLDIGGGEGRNALYLAELGFLVEVHDISSVGLDKLKALAKGRGVNINTKVTDSVIEKVEGFYDVVIISHVLHHLDREDSVKIINQAKKHTNINGVHVIETFSNQGDLYERNAKSERFYPGPEELRDLYKDWEIKELSNEDSTTYAKNKLGERMNNYIVVLVATKKA